MIKLIKFCQYDRVFLFEKFEKNFEWISSHHGTYMSNVPYKVRINRINLVRGLLLLSMSKKVNFVETKLLELKHLLD